MWYNDVGDGYPRRGIKMNFYQKVSELSKGRQWTRIVSLQEASLGKQAIWNGENIEFQESGFPDIEKWIPMLREDENASNAKWTEQAFFAETFLRRNRLIICGAGHIAIALVRMARWLPFELTVMDDRTAFVKEAEKAGADHVVCAPFDEAIASVAGDDAPYFIIATRGHRHDEVCLKAIEPLANQYVGMLGSKRRVQMLKKDLEESGMCLDFLNALHAPIGLSIFAKTPEEIAISILGEIIREKNKCERSIGFPEALLASILDPAYRTTGKALVTIIARKGSVPREVGAKMLVMADGRCIDTIGGGCMEAEIRQCALQCIDDGQAKVVQANMTAEQGAEEGMVCGGTVDVMIQPIASS